ncbi:NKF2 protein kinase [Aphelenchoides avenae]|nr:NKF2 protein kinase [Aphelenchus avenae]
MSFRRFGKVAVRFWEQVLSYQLPRRILPALKTVTSGGRVAKAVPRTVLRAPRTPISRNVFLRMVRGTLRNSRFWVRPFAALPYHHMLLQRQQDEHRRFQGLLRLKRRPPGGLLEGVRGLFGSNVRYNRALQATSMPDRLDGYELGNYIACGCNAAVYEAKRRQTELEAAADRSRHQWQLVSNEFPLALKIMFNYHFDAPERNLWHDMAPELVPLPDLPKHALVGRMANFKPLRRNHPNVVKMHTAFVDRMPILAEAERLFPEALPTAPFYELVVDEPRTLFVVMKRYRMTLREYVLTRPRNYWHGRVMFGQLLEAIVFLQEHLISHRDIKSDNILLDFDLDEEVPHLVLSDFGSSLAKGSWTVRYTDDSVDLGGNLSLRAPEVRRVRPGYNVVVDFQKADLWAAATIGYEIFTRANPFYSRMNSELYAEEDLPSLPRRVDNAVKQVVYRMLRIDPQERPTPQVAANVVSISLFRFGQDVKAFLEECGLAMGWTARQLKKSFSSTLNALGEHLERRLDDVTGLYAAETITARMINPRIISDAELQLRATFLARLQHDEVWSAMEYFFDEDAYRNHSGGYSTRSTSVFSGSSSSHEFTN